MPDQSPPYAIPFDHDSLFRLRANGSHSLILDFRKDRNHLVLIHQLTEYLLTHPPQSLVNVIPASLSVTLIFNEAVTANTYWQDFLTQAIDACHDFPINPKMHSIGICYQAQLPNGLATDLNSVCKILQCSESQLIDAHSSATYRVDMLGFLPGFAYLSGLPHALQLPRKSKPTLSVAAGSVAIAEQYSAIYPVDSPAGWHVIGRTSFPCINWKAENFCPFKPLDTIRFEPVSIEHASLEEWRRQS